jgi:hypothetical protein
MLYIITDSNLNCLAWHVGDSPIILDVNKIVEIQADGDELDLIEENGIIQENSGKRVASFCQKDARFIALAIRCVANNRS